MFEPTTTIVPGAGWALQNCTKATSKTRAQALDTNGDEGRKGHHSPIETENADFSASDETAQKLGLPVLGGTTKIGSWQLTFSNTAFPALSVSKASNVVGTREYKLANDIPNCPLGVPGSLFGVSGIENCKQAVVAASVQTASEYDGTKWIGECRDLAVTITLTGIGGDPVYSAGEGWDVENNSDGKHNTTLDDGTVMLVRHFKFTQPAS